MTFTQIIDNIKLRIRQASAAVVAAGIFLSVGMADAAETPKRSSDNRQQEFTVVLDAGHGGHDTGAVDNGAREKDINLGVAKKVERLLRKKLKNAKVVMTRDDDTFVSLQERANIANRNRGNLFVSIHTNSVDKSNPNRKSVSGTSVYALGLHKDQNNLKVAMRENSVIELENNYKQKYSGFDPSKDESYIIFEMAQKKNLGNSLRFANAAQKQLVGLAGRTDRGVKQAGFWVLWATTMPSVLVELDFICNPSQAAFMNSDEGQEKLAEALFNAIKNYAEGHAGNVAALPSVTPEPSADKGDAEANGAKPAKNAGSATSDSGVLVASSSKRQTTTPSYSRAKDAAPVSRARKRRSGSARKISDARVVEADNIPVTSEEDYFAAAETSDVAAPAEEKPEKEDLKDKKDKKAKKKKKQKSEQKEKKEQKETKEKREKNDAKYRRNSHKKTILVASNGQVATAEDSRGVRTISTPIYKVQLLASPERLDVDNPRFCGLAPVECFRENGMYKYTYGKSQSRADIENILLEIKNKIPDAFIIVSHK